MSVCGFCTTDSAKAASQCLGITDRKLSHADHHQHQRWTARPRNDDFVLQYVYRCYTLRLLKLTIMSNATIQLICILLSIAITLSYARTVGCFLLRREASFIFQLFHVKMMKNLFGIQKNRN